MGWKRLKDHFEITHQIRVTDSGIAIGSGYVPEIVTVNVKTGAITVSDVLPSFLREHYPRLASARPADVLALIAEEDSFSASVKVYTYDGARIVEKLCERPGWPNTTHDGDMMHENRYSTDKATVVEWARNNANIAVEMTRRHIAQQEKDLANLRAELTRYEADQAQIEAAYPTAAQHP